MFSAHKEALLAWAHTCLAYGVEHGKPPEVSARKFDPTCYAIRAVFVTLEKNGQLRGCIGHLEATQPLVNDVAENTVAAALEDSRFRPVTPEEVPDITIAISILSPPEPMPVASEDDLLAQLRPGLDGLIIGEGRRRATFLPSVWEELPDTREFLAHLKMKAGWPADYWSDRIRTWRYQAEYLKE